MIGGRSQKILMRHPESGASGSCVTVPGGNLVFGHLTGLLGHPQHAKLVDYKGVDKGACGDEAEGPREVHEVSRGWGW